MAALRGLRCGCLTVGLWALRVGLMEEWAVRGALWLRCWLGGQLLCGDMEYQALKRAVEERFGDGGAV